MLSVGSWKIIAYILDVVKTRRKNKLYLFLLFGGEGANFSVGFGGRQQAADVFFLA